MDKQICRNNLELEIDYLLKKRIIFHDQEPIIFNNFIKNWDCKIAQINRLETNHILSNSEINSNEKDLLLKKSGWTDFYWFSNGFLSLEWYRFYRYAKYLENNWQPTKTFSSYNRLLPNREHRNIISNYLYQYYKNKIILSAHYDLNQNNLFINTVNLKIENLSYTIHEKDFIDSFCHIVTERIFYENRIHLTEKVFRPIICCRPFILVSSPGALQYLKNYGFKTFNEFWNEDYDLIQNHTQRLEKILEIIKYIGSLNHKEILNMLHKMKSILLYNRNHFYNLFQETITRELFQNLSKSLNQTNNKNIIFKQIIENLTQAELNYVINSKVELDFDNTEDDHFQMNILSRTLNGEFKKINQDEYVIRPFVNQYIKHFKYYYICLVNSNKF